MSVGNIVVIQSQRCKIVKIIDDNNIEVLPLIAENSTNVETSLIEIPNYISNEEIENITLNGLYSETLKRFPGWKLEKICVI